MLGTTRSPPRKIYATDKDKPADAVTKDKLACRDQATKRTTHQRLGNEVGDVTRGWATRGTRCWGQRQLGV